MITVGRKNSTKWIPWARVSLKVSGVKSSGSWMELILMTVGPFSTPITGALGWIGCFSKSYCQKTGHDRFCNFHGDCCQNETVCAMLSLSRVCNCRTVVIYGRQSQSRTDRCLVSSFSCLVLVLCI
ncbi:Hypothetical protein PAS_chr2-1_0420 [Komagataella phaffii GS115]|uniref:Uncharacterized protein n=1 Tax=Komagataella phaffii (strain GS115 / ATCC 20864) TaxID=644223 RepID=C4R0L8_KOMPG|nr:Hypothetical protein PAS_chr2-1_0420 [Komagataella phaffii GS115]CAY69042.1 Hypothetical protein PAS_chr2-1_0420 [Komagataella phaffii GS115]